MSEGFFSRWSQRKQAAREATPAPSPAPVAPEAHASEAPAPARTAPPQAASGDAPSAQADLPTLEQAKALTPEADFSPFMQTGVAPEVRNAAVKRLFADPHFNVMDGLDIYIDDYNRPDPLPAAMLQKMVGARLLGLVQDEPPPARTATPQPLSPAQRPHAPKAPVAVAQSQPAPTDPCEPPTHDHAHLQLQPDPAPGAPDPGAPRG